MSYIEAPTNNRLPAYQYTILFEGTTYTLSYTFNSRMNKWLVDLADSVGNQLASQVPVVSSWFLFNRFKALTVPPGTLFAFDTSGQDEDPGRFDLGDRVRMLYATEGTIT